MCDVFTHIFTIALLALGQSHECPSASEAIRKGMVKISLYLTHKHIETHGCELSIVTTDALVLKHRAISTYRAD